MAGSCRKLWKCPRCGAKFVQRNLSHSCGRHSIDDFLAGRGPQGRTLFTRFAELIAKCGPHDIAPAKTRVAFMARVRFASVNRVTDEAICVHLVLPRKLESSRFSRIDRVGKVYVHHLRLERDGDFDSELQEWLRESYTEYGKQPDRHRANSSGEPH